MIDQSQIDLSATNERSVHDMYDAERRRDIEAWAALWHEEGRQTFPFSPTTTVAGRTGWSRSPNVSSMSGHPTKSESLPSPLPTLTASWPAFTSSCRAAPPSEVHIWCIFHFDDAGMITEVEEMLDTAAAPGMPQ